MLENPRELYRRCDEEQRRLLNQAVFHGIYIDEETIANHELKEPFARLHAAHSARRRVQSDKPDPGIAKGGGPVSLGGFEVLLGGIDSAPCSSKPSRVELRGLEPLTPTLPVWCATSCATAPCRPGLVCPSRWQLYRARGSIPRRGGDTREGAATGEREVRPASSERCAGGCRTGRGARSRCRSPGRRVPRAARLPSPLVRRGSCWRRRSGRTASRLRPPW